MQLYLIILLFLTFKSLGQAPVDIKSYLNSQQVSKTAKDFYYGKFKANDDTKTFAIIDSLKTQNNFTRPFYIFLVSKIMNKADGSLSESLGGSCKEFIELNPDFLIEFLFSKDTIVDKRFWDNWANQIAGEFIIECEGKEEQCIKKSLEKAKKNVKSDNKLKLVAFYHKIQNYLH